MVFGVGYYSYTIGNFTAILASFDDDNQELLKQMDVLKTFATTHKVPQNLYFKLKRALENRIV